MSEDAYTEPTRFERGFYHGAQLIVKGFNRAFWQASVNYEEQLPLPPYILSPTHRSNIDTLLVGSITGDRMTYMAKSGIFVNPAVTRFLRLLGGFPVDRGATDRRAVEIAQGALESGSSLVVYPEGTRRRGGRVAAIEEGAAFLALRAGVPIVPVGIAGTDRAMPKGVPMIFPVPVAIEVGRAVYPGSVREAATARVKRSEIRTLTDILEGELNRLMERARHSQALLEQSARRWRRLR